MFITGPMVRVMSNLEYSKSTYLINENVENQIDYNLKCHNSKNIGNIIMFKLYW